MAEAHFREESLKSTSALGGRTTVALVFVGHFDTFRRPTKSQSQLHKRLLPGGRLSMVTDSMSG